MYKININYSDGTHTISYTDIVTALRAYASFIEEVYEFTETVFSITYADIDGIKLVFKPE
jgi:hypothetical protein